MRYGNLKKFILFLPIVFVHSLAQAAAFQLYELGTPIIGTAAVGQAVTTDASSTYFNPASMTTTQIMLGSQIISPVTQFSIGSGNTISGNNGGGAGMLAPGLDIYYVYRHSQRLKLGVSLTMPYGGSLDYNNHWVGRYNVQQMTFYTLNLNPTVAYQINDWFALGAGVAVEYANLNQSVALPISASPPVDGQMNLKVNSTAPGLNVGAYFTPSNATKFGIAFRSQIVHHLHGNVDFLNISDTPNAHTKMVMPANVIASLSQMVSDRLTLLGEAGWANWSSMTSTTVTIDGYSATTPQHWHNTYRLGLAGKYQALASLLLKAGVSYDSSPTSASHRLPVLPMDRQVRVGLGLEYAVLQPVSLGVSYEYISFGNARIDNTSSAGVLAGSYPRNFANVFQLSLNVNC